MTNARNCGRSLAALTEREKEVVFECLRAASDGPFFPNWEFATLFGLERAQLRRIAAAAPHIDDSHEDTVLAIHNTLANLLDYPHHHESAWSQFISVPEEEVSRVFSKWRGDQVI
jgi:hypothetical protein